MPLVLAPLLVGVLPFLAALVLLGLSQASTSQHGSANSGTFSDIISGRLFWRQVGGFAASFSRWVVSHFAGGQLRMLTRWFVGMTTLTQGWFLGNAHFTEAVADALERIVHRGDPRARHKAAQAGAHAAAAAHAAHHANVHARSVGHALDRYKAHTNHRVHALTHAVDVAIPHDLAHIRARNKALERTQVRDESRVKALEDGATKTFEWIRTHPLSGVTAVFAGAVAVALARMGFGFLRCSNWKNLGKRITCGMGAWLSSLLDLIAVFGLATMALLEPEVLAQATVDAVDAVEPILSEILSR